MARCDSCGHDYDKPLQVTYQGKDYSFDTFQCAIHMLAPICRGCGCKVLGQGLAHGEDIYCCAHCAREAGVENVA